MKAEHRKELETNALADRIGKMVSNLKTGPQRGVGLYVVLGILVAALVFFSVRWYRVSKNENSEAWMLYDVGEIKALLESYPETNSGRAARLILTAHSTWTEGIKKLGADPKGALESLDRAAEQYEQIKTEIEGDPVLEPEVLYALAQIEETFAVKDSSGSTAPSSSTRPSPRNIPRPRSASWLRSGPRP